MEIRRTDVEKIIRYLSAAAELYDSQPGQRNVCRAWVIRQTVRKLNKKLSTIIKNNKK